MPTITAIGAANPRAHGQATINTDTAQTTAIASCPASVHARNDTIAMPTTSGTNIAETLSTSDWIGIRLRCASPTRRTMRDSVVSPLDTVTSATIGPVPFIVPARIGSRTVFDTGSGSPVSIDSSASVEPSVMVPSTGMRSPG